MHTRTLLALLASLSLTLTPIACSSDSQNDRWVTTENTNVTIDWDQVNEAYKQAEGPEDFERRINEIYTGDEIISVSVKDADEKQQLVTGFFDHNRNGSVEDAEKIFTIQRDITGEGQGQYQIQGSNHYGYYRSPVWDIASGMLLGSMISRAFMPGYAPMYTSAYVTSPSRAQNLATQRSRYRSANPSKFSNQGAKSRSGRSYGGSSRSRGGGGFGIKRRANLRVVRLTS